MMKYILILIVFPFSAKGQIINSSPNFIFSSGNANGYAHYRILTVNHGQVPNTDQTNFTVGYINTLASLKTTANGGSVTNANGYDIIVTYDLAGTRIVPFDLESYTATSGAIVLWFLVANLSHTADSTYYLWYGNATVSTFQGGATGVAWNSGYKGIYHVSNGTVLSLLDATSSGFNGTNNSATATTGQIDGGIGLSGTSQYVNLGNNLGFIGDFTIDVWANPTDFVGFDGLVSKTATNQPKPYDFYLAAATGKPTLFIGDGAGASGSIAGTNAPTTGAWNHIVVVKSGTNTITHYLNGAANGSGNASGAPNPLVNGTNNTFIATRSDLVLMFKGSMDDIRVSNVTRSADWVTSEYNNGNAPTSFVTTGSEN